MIPLQKGETNDRNVLPDFKIDKLDGKKKCILGNRPDALSGKPCYNRGRQQFKQ